MKNELSKNERIDALGRKLLETSSLTGDELEGIVAAPHIFASVKARINAEKAVNGAVDIRQSHSIFAFRWVPAVSFAVIVVAVLAISAVFIYRLRPESVATTSHAGQAEVIVLTEPVTETPKNVINDGPGDVKSAALVFRDTLKARPALKTNFKKKARLNSGSDDDPDGDFYPLSLTGNGEEIASGGQVVRVDLPRASLIAMGVNLPPETMAENLRETVKTDLLIGSDGVTRGFRFVK